MNEISVIIPVINEASGIARVIQDCKKFAYEVIVVDGGSYDGTQEIARSNGAIVIDQRQRGYGLALITGFQHATGSVIATADGDGTYPVAMIPELVAQLSSSAVFISGSRTPLMDVRSMRTRNRIGNALLSWLGSLLWLHRFQDILSGMWVFNRCCLPHMELYSRKWDLSQEIKLEAYKVYGTAFKEVHIPYYERHGESKLFPFRVGFENLLYFFIQRLGLRSHFNRRYEFNH